MPSTGLYSVGGTGAPSPQGGANFGNSVALSATHALIGASGYDYPTLPASNNSGNAYLYTITGPNAGDWTGMNGLLSVGGAPTAQAAGAGFGISVALSATQALIGAQYYDYPGASGIDHGNAYLYTITGA